MHIRSGLRFSLALLYQYILKAGGMRGGSEGHRHTSKGVRKKRSTGLGVHP